jgi:PTS system nitrogen regulatory IIA component
MDKTFIDVKEMAGKMGVSEKTIYRMVNDNRIPFAVKIGGQWRFRIDALTGWLTRQEGNAMPETGATKTDISLHEALQQGAVLYRIHGHNRDEAIDELLSILPYTSAIDLEAIKVSILARESLVPSSMKSIAYMGISFDQPVFVEKTMVLLAFLETPMDFKALDGRKTEAVFLVLPANFAEQNIIEMKLRRLSMEKAFLQDIARQRTRKELLDNIHALEHKIFIKGPGPGQKSAGNPVHVTTG